MGEGESAGRGYNPVLRFFGLHSGEKAAETLAWVAPYLGVFVCLLVGMSILIQRFFPLPLWVYLVAVVAAGGNCFLFLARIRQSALENHDATLDGHDGDGAGEEE